MAKYDSLVNECNSKQCPMILINKSYGNFKGDCHSKAQHYTIFTIVTDEIARTYPIKLQ